MRKTQTVRYIKPETICIGDVIRVTRKFKDTEQSVVGRVADRQQHTYSTEYSTAEGVVLYEHFRFNQQKVTVTLLERPLSNLTPLFDFDDMMRP
jgi:hypothetical protein